MHSVFTTSQVSAKSHEEPILWVEDIIAAYPLAQLFQILQYKDIAGTIPKGEHYILADKGISEAIVRGLAWKIALSSGCECKVYSCQLNAESLLVETSGVSAKELIIQIVEFAQPFDDWALRLNEEPLKLKEAAEIATVAIALLKEPQKSIELGTLRERCKQSSYDWNKLMGKLEEEFQRELERRQGTNVETDADERLRLELMALLKEADPIKKARKKAKIATHYSIKLHEIDKILSQLRRQSTTPEVKVYDIDDLFALESAGLEWLIPELLPKGETIILAGDPKAGKSLLSIDAAFAIATGESSFLGETTKRGKVLLVCPDASLTSVKNQLLKRGFRATDKDHIRIIPMWTIDQIDILEEQLEDFRPDLTIVDSLRRINHGSPVSENSAEFADNIYTLKETIGKYNSAGILIHHTNKNQDAMGVGKLRGSSAIAGAVWGTWQLSHIPKPDPNNKNKLIIDPADPRRVLSVFARDTEGQSINIGFNPENNSWEKTQSEVEEEHTTIKERILNLLELNRSGLSGKEIIYLLGMAVEEGRGVYTQLNRMANKRLISCKPAPGDKRYNIYSLPTETLLPPPPPHSVEIVEYKSESITVQGLDNTQQNTQQPLNNYSTHEGLSDHVEDLSVDTASNPKILNNFNEKQRGGVVGGNEIGENSTSTTSSPGSEEYSLLPPVPKDLAISDDASQILAVLREVWEDGNQLVELFNELDLPMQEIVRSKISTEEACKLDAAKKKYLARAGTPTLEQKMNEVWDNQFELGLLVLAASKQDLKLATANYSSKKIAHIKEAASLVWEPKKNMVGEYNGEKVEIQEVSNVDNLVQIRCLKSKEILMVKRSHLKFWLGIWTN
ncbi:putative replicative DNA helicase [Tolypothrix sp. NIES-4075]|uniref:AAA family ATPase n=1 Tax=Tolypothrix sp. NIES-4075 TaxID=2005459 RepID=UPI000B74FA60|nr:AAA family ATPase [Tolypothrix sp. NIES-4075]GAX46169.1 putative replicative DNA helicase [Tolypothrix sp. NIES-4075]